MKTLQKFVKTSHNIFINFPTISSISPPFSKSGFCICARLNSSVVTQSSSRVLFGWNSSLLTFSLKLSNTSQAFFGFSVSSLLMIFDMWSQLGRVEVLFSELWLCDTFGQKLWLYFGFKKLQVHFGTKHVQKFIRFYLKITLNVLLNIILQIFIQFQMKQDQVSISIQSFIQYFLK